MRCHKKENAMAVNGKYQSHLTTNAYIGHQVGLNVTVVNSQNKQEKEKGIVCMRMGVTYVTHVNENMRWSMGEISLFW